ncbi:MAG: hypothetical protein K8L91_21010 [Anaerolineae bacterium]|nr:hypothetical protein [Anaerolineae bacterium]
MPTASYTYDAVGSLTSITDARGNVTSFQYDALNQQTRKTWPDNTYETFGYDAVGNLTQHVLAVGTSDEVTHNFQYNAMNRLTQATYGTQTYSYTYTPSGWRDTITDARGVTNYDYDAQSRVTQIQFPDTRVVGYTYDRAGNRLSMTTPAGTTQYTYNDANLLATVDGGSGVTTYTYDEVGVLTGMAYPNGVNTTYTYDAVYHLTDILQQNGSQTLGSYHYTLDNAGNRLRVDELGGSYYLWDYDDYYRLSSEERYASAGVLDYSAAYQYDPAGNRLSETVNGVTTTSTYNNLDQLTQSITGGVTTTYAYDTRGNLEQMVEGSNTTTYTWDAQDRLVNAVTPNGTVNYVYDAGGRRVQQTANGQVTNYLWDELSTYGDVILETDGTGTTLASYVLGNDHLVSQNRGGMLSYYLQDGQGSTRALTNTSGVVTDTYSYTAFGEIYSQTGATVNSYLYGGQQYDDSIGLYSLRARYYAPITARFASQDVNPYNFQNPTELNRYGYTANNPISFGDPSGFGIIETILDYAKVAVSVIVAFAKTDIGIALAWIFGLVGFIALIGVIVRKVVTFIIDMLYTDSTEKRQEENRRQVKEWERKKTEAEAELERLKAVEAEQDYILSQISILLNDATYKCEIEKSVADCDVKNNLQPQVDAQRDTLATTREKKHTQEGIIIEMTILISANENTLQGIGR